MSADGRDAAVAKELRFSIVMYGGVSLAIYMNGVTQELFHMVRATARDSWDYRPDMKFRFKDESEPEDDPRPVLKGTETFYRKLANLLNDEGVDDVRFIIDVISGTSAGGINGIFLAKALSNDRLSFDLLKTLWINEGAIENLLNDRQTQKGVGLPVDNSPKSLLCSDRMYIKLLTALTGMLSAETAQQGKPNALVREIDLFATSTDINGRVHSFTRSPCTGRPARRSAFRRHGDTASRATPAPRTAARSTNSTCSEAQATPTLPSTNLRRELRISCF
jgi:patatin-related protein